MERKAYYPLLTEAVEIDLCSRVLAGSVTSVPITVAETDVTVTDFETDKTFTDGGFGDIYF